MKKERNITLNTMIKKALTKVNTTEKDIYLFIRYRYLYKGQMGLLPIPQYVWDGLFKVVSYKFTKKTFYITPQGQEKILDEIVNTFPALGFGVSIGAYNGCKK